MRRCTAVFLVATLTCLLGTASAEDRDKRDPTGTWEWHIGQRPGVKLKLKLEGDKLYGSIGDGWRRETPIENGTFKDGAFTFTVTRLVGNEKKVNTYKGKANGDTMRGTLTGEYGGRIQERNWVAKRWVH